jgi:hypothetical protein
LSGPAKRSTGPIGREQAGRDHHVDAGNGHDPLGVLIGERVARDLPLHDPKILAETVVLAQMTGDRILLVGWQRLSEQPSPSFRAEQIGVWAGRHQVRVQDRLDDRLQPRPLTADLIAARDLPPQCQVPWSGTQTSGRKPLAYSRASTVAWMTSVLMRASAIRRTWRGLAIATRPTCGRITSATAVALPVAST